MRWLRAPAKINLTLRVIERRADGYHELESLVAFAGLFDWLGFEPGDDLILEVLGPRANEAGPIHENLVVRAARSLAARMPGLRLGRFRLSQAVANRGWTWRRLCRCGGRFAVARRRGWIAS